MKVFILNREIWKRNKKLTNRLKLHKSNLIRVIFKILYRQ